MKIVVQVSAGPGNWERYHAPLTQALLDVGIDATVTQTAAPETVDYLVYAPSSPLQDFTAFNRCKAVLSLWAGVERVVGNPTLTQPLCRMVDPALTQGMIEWVTGHSLRHHLNLDQYINNPDRIWNPECPPLASERVIAMLGIGALGQACAQSLRSLGFHVLGWSRAAKVIDGIQCYHGDDGLKSVLQQAQIVVTLLPKTAETENILNARALGWLPQGAVILNPGRGALIDDDALLAALATGQVAHATLDVFRVEPLPLDHPFWAHPQVTVTPHIAADTRPATSAKVLAENIRRGEAHEPFLHLVDRHQGY